MDLLRQQGASLLEKAVLYFRLILQQWQNGRKGKDGWNRYTRRRKWCRDAELVEISPERTPPLLPARHDDFGSTTTTLVGRDHNEAQSIDTAMTTGKHENDGQNSVRRKKGWFARRESQPNSEKSAALSSTSMRSAADDEDDVHSPLKMKDLDREVGWGVQDDARMGLG